jgi:hypothetical protein
MSSGGLMQLVAYGAQDVYLTGNPQITFFKIVYRRHTNFSMEINEIPFNSGSNNFGGGKHSVTISRNGDLITQIYLHATLNQIVGDKDSKGAVAWCRRLGHALIDSVEIDIGGSRIDKHYGTWLDIWYELTHTAGMERGYKRMIGDVPELTDLSFGKVVDENKIYKGEYSLYVPLQFWFNRENGLALPLIALQYHEVKIDFEFRSAKDLMCYTDNFDTSIISKASFKEINLLVNYIYLDNEERRKFAQVGHEYLIEQLQYTGSYPVPTSISNESSIVQTVDLNFNHPTKELVWVMKSGNYTEGKKFLGYSGSLDDDEATQYAAQNILNHSVILNNYYPYGKTKFEQFFSGIPKAKDASGNEQDYYKYEDLLKYGYAAISTTKNFIVIQKSDGTKHHITVELKMQKELETIWSQEQTEDHNSQIKVDVGSTTPEMPYVFLKLNGMNIKTHTLHDLLTKIDEIEIKIGVYDLYKFNDTNPTEIETTALSGSAYIDATMRNLDNIFFEIKPVKHHISIRDISIPVSSVPSHWQEFTVSNPFSDVSSVIVHDHCNYGILLDGTCNPVDEVVLQFNGHDRFDRREGPYFNYVQPYEHHTRTPVDGVNVYSFAINPENHQPSGSANLSRIDTTRLNVTYKDSTVSKIGEANVPVFSSVSRLYVYDVNYNVLRILSGMGGLAYSN